MTRSDEFSYGGGERKTSEELLREVLGQLQSSYGRASSFNLLPEYKIAITQILAEVNAELDKADTAEN